MSALWGISDITTTDGPLSFPLSFDDYAADVATADDLLESLGLGPGSAMLVAWTFSEAGLYTPLFEAAWRRRVIVSCAEATAPDGYRVALLSGALPRIAAVVGINGAVLDGLEAAGRDLADVFRAVPVVAARPDACWRLNSLGVPARLWAHLGPVLSVECAARGGAHVPRGWSVAVDAGGRLTVSPETLRAGGRGPWRIPGRWRLSAGDCSCGRRGQRVTPRDPGQ
jgi:hypothetical protein